MPLPAAVDALLIATAVVNPKAAMLSAFTAVLGSAIGCMILFYLARKGGEAYLERHTQSENAAKFSAWFQTYGLITVFVPCLLPIPMPLKVFVLSAGALGVKPLHFLGVVVAARVPRYFGLAWLGMHLGHDAGAWIKSHVVHLCVFAALLALALYLAVKLTARESRSPIRP